MLAQTYFCEAEKPTTAAFADFYCSVIEAKPLNSATAALFSRTYKCIRLIWIIAQLNSVYVWLAGAWFHGKPRSGLMLPICKW